MRNTTARTVCAYVLALAFLAGAVPGAAKSETMYVLCTPGSTVNIRERPNIHAQVSGRLFFGDVVSVTDKRTDSHGRVWRRVEDVTEWGFGWVAGSFLTSSEPSETDREATIEASGRVAVRDEPGGNRIAWKKPGDKVRILVYSDAWSLTDCGYIASEFLNTKGGV